MVWFDCIQHYPLKLGLNLTDLALILCILLMYSYISNIHVMAPSHVSPVFSEFVGCKGGGVKDDSKSKKM
jgi:hypothetical protein